MARIIYWLLTHQHKLCDDQLKITVTCGKQGVKYSVEAWYQDTNEDAA